MSAPLWWIWLATLTRLLVWGEPYYMLSPREWGRSWFIAGVVRQAIRSIRVQP